MITESVADARRPECGLVLSSCHENKVSLPLVWTGNEDATSCRSLSKRDEPWTNWQGLLSPLWHHWCPVQDTIHLAMVPNIWSFNRRESRSR